MMIGSFTVVIFVIHVRPHGQAHLDCRQPRAIRAQPTTGVQIGSKGVNFEMFSRIFFCLVCKNPIVSFPMFIPSYKSYKSLDCPQGASLLDFFCIECRIQIHRM